MSKHEALKLIGEDILSELRQQAMDVGQSLTGSLEEVGEYIGERVAHLSTVVGEPGFREALTAERDSICLKAAGRAVIEADLLDARLLASAQTGLMVASRLLVLIP